MKTKYIRITKFTLAMLILIVVQFSNVIAQEPLPPTATDKCVSGNCVNGKGKMVYANGDIYEGSFINGKREGQGTLTYKNGEIYIGQFANNIFNGRGKLTFFSGEIYDGNWVDDKFNGKGKLTFPNGNIYDGDFVNDKKEGQGTYTYKNGNYYIGEYKNDKQNGYGKEFIKATNATREGTWKDGFLIASTTSTTSTTSTNTEVVAKTGTLADCKFILSEGCRNYLLQATTADILPQFKDAFIFEGKELVSNAFRAKIVAATGGILSVEFSGEFKNPFGQPAENVKWGESVAKVKKKYGEPLKINLDSNRATHIYKNFELVYFVNKLRGINFSRNITESEIATQKVAEENRNRRNAEARRIANIPEAERIANTPEWKLKEYFIANKEIGEKMDKYTLDINKLVSRYNEWVVKYGKTVEVKKIGYDVTHLCYEVIQIIDTFLLKYPDQISSKRKSELLQVRKDYASLMNPK